MKILYFTATGNNLYVAKRIGSEYYSIPKLIKEERFEFEDEQIGIIFPVYGLGVPEIIEAFLNKVKLKSKYIFAVISYGKFSGSAASRLEEIGKRNGIEFSYINEILMVDNYLPVYDIKNEIQKEPKKLIEENLENIITDINKQKKYIRKNSSIRKFFSKYLPKIFENNHAFDNNFYLDNGCIGCGVCTKVCPINNIKLVNKKPAYQGNCMKCLACINHCPKNVIRLKGERSKIRFINQNITLNEIINANN
ncbi:ferredoxin-2 [Clostridium puniceum]|uniref:Ferredoxin-2 n=1 Tax=Clostridium puniceum TaxID=29367 RepID=A0A1S8TWL3_9CLOT|nr:EFR1 family ferrodoxin [Clostridium puniceum]OOM81982.1 ferredoxin-2 [Clostridium puniceum]